MQSRRTILLQAGTLGLVLPLCPNHPFAQIRNSAVTLLSAPIEMAGDWGHMLPRSAEQVVERMRHSCLDGIRLVSDGQPTRLRVDEHPSGNPAIWLHPDGSTMHGLSSILANGTGRSWPISLATNLAMSWRTAGSRMRSRRAHASGLRKPWWRRFRSDR